MTAQPATYADYVTLVEETRRAMRAAAEELRTATYDSTKTAADRDELRRLSREANARLTEVRDECQARYGFNPCDHSPRYDPEVARLLREGL